EFLFRPLERWLEGGLSAQKQLDRDGPNGRRVLKYAVFGLLSLGLAHVFLAYFVDLQQLMHWVTRSPFEHPSGFLVVGTTALLIFADFGYFREQMCTIACPYARLQSALLDPSSLVVGYDRGRGEPRGRGDQKGDCVDCGACVVTCPTGIDIREGLQVECIACAQCVDACDSVMLKFQRPLGLIRYDASHRFSEAKQSILPRRGRVALYALLLGGLLTALAIYAQRTQRPEITLLRGIGAPFQVQDGRVQNQIRIKLENRKSEAVSYRLELEQAPGAELVAPENPIRLAAGARTTTSVFVTLPASAFHGDSLDVKLVFRGEQGDVYERQYRLLGPGRSGS
ncbi:MAG TPA: 4Fe-4S dicluster domain-containing protein, partial [Polyangiaceae bacterium]|nr:4Fe-4S dicluster domain-containing protein [Polyangiaceae bacterium]